MKEASGFDSEQLPPFLAATAKLHLGRARDLLHSLFRLVLTSMNADRRVTWNFQYDGLGLSPAGRTLGVRLVNGLTARVRNFWSDTNDLIVRVVGVAQATIPHAATLSTVTPFGFFDLHIESDPEGCCVKLVDARHEGIYKVQAIPWNRDGDKDVTIIRSQRVRAQERRGRASRTRR